MLGRRALAPVLIATFVAAACQSDEPGGFRPRVPIATPTKSNTRLIALVGTLSGEGTWRGDDAFEGAQVSVNVLNRKLRPRERMFELVTHDDRGDPEQARLLIEQALTEPRLAGILYAGPPGVLPATEPALAAAGLPALALFGDLYTLRNLSAHVFQLGPAFLWEARVLARYLMRDRGYDRIGIMVEDTESGRAAEAALEEAVGELGGRVVAFATFPVEGRPLNALSVFERERLGAIVVEGSDERVEALLQALRSMGARYRSTRAAKRGARRGSGAAWRPQIAGFDPVVSPRVDPELLAPGMVGADTYARGAHYLPVPSFRKFVSDFRDWWGRDETPLGWQRRAYDGVQMLGWAARRATGRDADLAAVLERMRGARFGGLDVTFGPDDHTAVDQPTVGIWTVPRDGIEVPERDRLPSSMPWVPLARGFSIDGERTDVLDRDWRWLFRGAPRGRRPAPRVGRMRFGVTTSRSDPVH